jgi:hypothetical protein
MDKLQPRLGAVEDKFGFNKRNDAKAQGKKQGEEN